MSANLTFTLIFVIHDARKETKAAGNKKETSHTVKSLEVLVPGTGIEPVRRSPSEGF